ncbi:shikimate dehydrogenase [Rhabdothermincola salaria]|uniref:shikimate dehydrogenase n=1 Tax=Rhabdothermincola salaria TaxID=2903142 RepID=UPI001E5C7949|nr:shikimate dehydrogenase [Rhabdothermincola salaria]
MSVDGAGRAAPTGATRVAAVIGEPVGHSRSPAIMNAAFAATGLDWVYVAFEVPAGAVPAALGGMRAFGIGGLSVTMPHKEAAAGAVDELSDDARRLGAVNCVVNDDGTLRGHNTDGAGFVAALVAETGVSPAGLPCVVLGAGGAARSVVLALSRAGADQVTVVNRTSSRAERAAALAGDRGRVVAPADAPPVLAEAGLVVNATSVGMGEGAGGATPFDPEVLHEGQLVADLVYQPLVTPLLAEAGRRGATPVDGLGMLVHQAAVAFELWTGTPAPVADMAAAARASLARGS